MACNSNEPLRLLSLDGGGVRGLSSLFILRQLMELVDPRNPPKPCNFFHMIGGTSTGGLIAVMLGRLEMDIDHCIDAYVNMMDRVFRKEQHRIAINGGVQARFSTEELERSIKKVIKENGLDEDALMRCKESKDEGCKVFVCAVSSQHRDYAVQFPNYHRSEHFSEADSELFNNAKIWEVCRATSAATTFFAPITIGRHSQVFLDGATRMNNPVEQLLREARKVWSSSVESRIHCLVSIGTGKPGVKPFGDDLLSIGRTFMAIATETERTADAFREDHQQLDDRNGYYRFNVTQGLEDVGLEDVKSRDKVSTMTGAYMSSSDTQRVLREFRGVIRNVEIKITPKSIPPQPQSFAFLTLDGSSKYLRPVKESYWGHVTIDGLSVYENIYDACCDPHTGLVSFGNFCKQFSGSRPTADLIHTAWQRIDRAQDSLLPKSLVLAIIYMLHVESFLPGQTPKPMSLNRRKILECYGNWISCACQCGRKWNFANGLDGLRKDSGKYKSCMAARWKDSGALMRKFLRMRQGAMTGPELYDQNRTNWLSGRQSAVPTVEIGSK